MQQRTRSTNHKSSQTEQGDTQPSKPANGRANPSLRTGPNGGLPNAPIVATPRGEVLLSARTAQACRQLRVSLTLAANDTPLQAVLVTSPLPQEGKSFTSLGLALSHAAAGRRAILVEADLYKPTLARTLAVPSSAVTVLDALADPYGGWQPLIRGGLHVLPAPPTVTNPTAHSSAPAFEQLFSRLRQSYADIVVDAPPANIIGDTLLLGRLVDGVVVVMNANRTHRAAHRRLRRALEDASIPRLGVILNRASWWLDGGEYGDYGEYAEYGAWGESGDRSDGQVDI
jgi:capsular exopolysaccharide synthesis family protein